MRYIRRILSALAALCLLAALCGAPAETLADDAATPLPDDAWQYNEEAPDAVTPQPQDAWQYNEAVADDEGDEDVDDTAVDEDDAEYDPGDEEAADGEAFDEDASDEEDVTLESILEKGENGSLIASKGLEVYFFDLGRVDGILICCDGETAFIDAGFKEDATEAIRYMKYLGVKKLNAYIGTHAHADHIEGGPRIINAFRPETIYINRSATMAAMLEVANSSERKVIKKTDYVILKPKKTFNIGEATITCLGPLQVKNYSVANTKENYNSLILRLDYGERSFLFTGDTMDSVLRSVNRKYPGMLDVDVLKNPHHNGKHDPDVIDMISPKVTVFCTDDENVPTRKYRSQLRQQGSRIYMTGSSNNGNVVIVSDGKNMDLRLGYPLTELKIKSNVPDLLVGQTYALKGSIKPRRYANASRWLAWKSSDNRVAQVSAGKVKAIAPGTATISAVSFNKIVASVDVTVYDVIARLEKTKLSIAVGEDTKLRAKILPEGTKGITGKWVSADSSILVVLPDGEIIGASEGTTQAIAQLSNGYEAVCEVTVSGFMVDSIKLDKHKANMKVGEVLTLNAKVKPEVFQDMPLEWRSSNEKILWVDMDGNVTAVGRGTAKIGVRARDGVYDVCTIKVG